VKSFVIDTHFDECHKFIDESLMDYGGLLVHCIVGRSRSPTVIISYLMKHHKMTLKEAYDHVKNKRDIVRPNDGFIQSLINYEKKLFGFQESTLLWKFKFDKGLILNQLGTSELPKEDLEAILKDDDLVRLYNESGSTGYEKSQIATFIKFCVPILVNTHKIVNKPELNKFLSKWFVSRIKSK
jgi:hypothetical protein